MIKDYLWVLYLLFFELYSLFYGAFSFYYAGYIGLLIAVNFYLLGSVLGLYIRLKWKK